MAKKAQPGEASKSDSIREVLKANPQMKVKEVVEALAAKDIKVTPNLVYYIKGKIKGKKGKGGRPRKVQVDGAPTATTATTASAPRTYDALATINKVKALAADVGGFTKLKAILEALGG